MKISEVLEKIADYHPKFGPDYSGADGIKCGDPDTECTGIVSALVPNMDVLRKTAELGANLLYVHEPTSYLTPDLPGWRAAYPCHVFDEKMKFAAEHGIVIYRDHDHLHAHRPDGIFTGVIKYLGWENYLVDRDVPFAGYRIELPEAMTVRELNRHFIHTIGMSGVRYVGRPDDKIRSLGIVGHIYPGAFMEPTEENGIYNDYATEIIRLMEETGLQAILPGEVIEWTVISYIRDAISLGEARACFNLGHYNWEELGARYAVDWIGDITDHKVPITHVRCGDLWSFQLPENR